MTPYVQVTLECGAKGFAEDKDEAKKLRTNTIMPALAEDKMVVIDFHKVTSSTQSFVHALVGEPLQKYGEDVLKRIEFRSCAPQVKSLVQLVVDYSLGGFTGSTSPMEIVLTGKKKPPEKLTAGRSKLRPGKRK